MKAKKLLAIALAAALTVTAMPATNLVQREEVAAETGKVNLKDKSISGFQPRGVDDSRKMIGDFDITYNFTAKYNGSESALMYHGYALEFYVDGDGYYDIQAGGYSWLNRFQENKWVEVFNSNKGYCNMTPILTYKEGKTQTAYLTALKDSGVTYSINIFRHGDCIEYVTECEYFTLHNVITGVKPDWVFVSLGGDTATFTNVSITTNEVKSDYAYQIADFSAAYTGKRLLSGDFTAVYTFKNKGTIGENWFNYNFEIRDDDHKGLTVRADNYGWIFAGTEGNLQQDASPEGSWDNFQTKMAAGQDCKLTITRRGNDFTFVLDNSFLKITMTANVELKTNLTIALGGEKVTLSNVCFSTDGQYKLDAYRGETYVAPTQYGKVFAGWFEDAECTKAIGQDVKAGYAYAKFVDAKLLQVKNQLTAGTTAESESTDARFMLAVDGLDYQTVGFTISKAGGTPTTRESSTVCSSIKVNENRSVEELKPATVFETEAAKYMLSVKVTDIPQANFNTEISAIPYWITLDGTKVTGATKTFKVSEHYKK